MLRPGILEHGRLDQRLVLRRAVLRALRQFDLTEIDSFYVRRIKQSMVYRVSRSLFCRLGDGLPSEAGMIAPKLLARRLTTLTW